jgi:hypothetical protein
MDVKPLGANVEVVFDEKVANSQNLISRTLNHKFHLSTPPGI